MTNWDFVFVIAMGRSGSTVVQGLLNAIPSVLVRGENFMFPVQLLQAQAALVRTQDEHRFSPDATTDPWYGAMSLNRTESARAIGGLIRDQLGSAPTVGFKEIRWHEIDTAELPGIVSAADASLGRVGWLLHHRAYEEVRVSNWWSAMPEAEVTDVYRKTEAVQNTIHSLAPHNTFWSDYADMQQDFTGWNARLLDWMGVIPEHALLRRMHTVKATHHSY